MVGGLVADEREVEPGRAQGAELREVGVVREQPVEGVEEGGSSGGPDLVREGRDGGEVRRAGLEHERPAGGAARIHVDHHAHVLAPRVAPGKGGGPEHPLLLRVGEEGDDVVAERRAHAEGPHHLHQDGDARGVVPRPR